MTYAAEHRGMPSTCPHCQSEVTLGRVAPGAVPRVTPNSGPGNPAKIVAWVASGLLVIGLAVAAILFILHHKTPAKPQGGTVTASADAQAVADDAEQYLKALEDKVGSGFKNAVALNGQLAATKNPADALRIANDLEPAYENIVFMIDNGTAPNTDEVKVIKKQMFTFYTAEIQNVKDLQQAIESRDEKNYTALLNDQSIQQVVREQKMTQFTSGLEAILKRANHGGTTADTLNKIRCSQGGQAIDLAKRSWALDKNKSDDAAPSASDLLPYLDGNKMPACPDGGTYTIGSVTNKAYCSLPAHAGSQ